jgi:hypothetical protein
MEAGPSITDIWLKMVISPLNNVHHMRLKLRESPVQSTRIASQKPEFTIATSSEGHMVNPLRKK